MNFTNNHAYYLPPVQQQHPLSINGFQIQTSPLLWSTPRFENYYLSLSFQISPYFSNYSYSPVSIFSTCQEIKPQSEMDKEKENENKQFFLASKSQGLEEQRISSDKSLQTQKNITKRDGHKKVVRKIKIKRKNLQNPKRNIVTNIGNQIITFSTNKVKCQKALESLFIDLSQQEFTGFFSYTNRLRSKIGYYLNYSKMKKLWYPKGLSSTYEVYQKMFRTISFYFLNHMFRLIVLKSGKMKRDSKNYHLKAIRRLIRDMRRPPKF